LWSAGLLYAQVQQAEQTPADLLRNFKSMYVNANTVYIKNGVTEGAILKELQKKHLARIIHEDIASAQSLVRSGL